MVKKKKSYDFLIETPLLIPNNELVILEESKTNSGDHKLKFKTRLQEANMVNANKRRYSTTICESIVSQLTPKANNKQLLQEIDHPLFDAPSDKLKQRAAIIEIKNCGSVINKIEFKDNQILAEISTLSGFRGPDLARLIFEDHIDIGFSLRALGSITPVNEILEVQQPIQAYFR
ncbi:MAG: hypothetical protein LBV58_01140 [Acholeplasmatales bacterium]|jgi:hypothetical protein|nr:hypothetical protein [Acholeplasmatales bacterium]